MVGVHQPALTSLVPYGRRLYLDLLLDHFVFLSIEELEENYHNMSLE